MSRLLTLDETYKCLKCWRELQDKDAYTLLVNCNIGLVTFLSKKYLGKGFTLDELMSAGNLGLINAINKFNYKENSIKSFSTYIGVSIENSIKTELANYNKHKNIVSFEETIGRSEEGNDFTVKDILRTDEDEIMENVMNKMKNSIIYKVLMNLTEEEREIIILRFGLDGNPGKTIEELSKIYECTPAKMENKERKILRKLRHPKNSKELRRLMN